MSAIAASRGPRRRSPSRWQPGLLRARGHQYFAPKDIGYEAPFALRIPTFVQFIKARIVGVRTARSGRERDHVQPDWAPFWWLRYDGPWAGSSLQPIHGPATQEIKWTRSWDWVVASGQADADWTDVF